MVTKVNDISHFGLINEFTVRFILQSFKWFKDYYQFSDAEDIIQLFK